MPFLLALFDALFGLTPEPTRATFLAPLPDDRPRAPPALAPPDFAPDFRAADLPLFLALDDFFAPDDFFAVPVAFRMLGLAVALRPGPADLSNEALFAAAGLFPDEPVPRVTGLRGVGVAVAGREIPPEPLLELRVPVAPLERGAVDPPGRPAPDALEGLELALPVPPARVEIGC